MATVNSSLHAEIVTQDIVNKNISNNSQLSDEQAIDYISQLITQSNDDLAAYQLVADDDDIDSDIDDDNEYNG